MGEPKPLTDGQVTRLALVLLAVEMVSVVQVFALGDRTSGVVVCLPLFAIAVPFLALSYRRYI